MAVTKWSCFGCGLPMQADHESGQTVVLDLCPSCIEKAQGKHTKRRRDADPNDDGA